MIKKLLQLKEALEVNIQQLATELDTSARCLCAIVEDECTTGEEIAQLQTAVQDITRSISGQQIVAFDDNTELYEWCDVPVVVYAGLNRTAIIFDNEHRQDVESLLSQL